jgi:hypothetical protein
VRALLTPDVAPKTGIVVFRPGAEVMPLFRAGRVLIELPPENLQGTPSGLLPLAHQPLAESDILSAFFSADSVFSAAGGVPALEYRLMRAGGCQWPHSEYHHHEQTALRYGGSAIRLCWHCDNHLRDQTLPELDAIAGRNRNEQIIDRARRNMGFDDGHILTLPELCWWAVVNGIADALPEGAARAALRMPPELVVDGPFRESDLVPPSAPAVDLMKKLIDAVGIGTPPALNLTVDAKCPGVFMRRPKRIRWENASYTEWVKTQPCVICGQRADDAHHLIGHGQGGTGTKSHDLFTIPLCRAEHGDLHADPVAWEAKHGSQIEWVVRTLDRALALGVIATSD